MTPGQCRAARGLVQIDQADLAGRASVSRNTIVDFESGRRTPTANNLKAIGAALEAAGVEFIPENGGGAGVRLRKSNPKLRKWWEIHLEPEAGWIEGDQQGDFGRVITRGARSTAAVLTVREFDDGEAAIVWRSQNAEAVASAVRRHPTLLSGNPAPAP